MKNEEVTDSELRAQALNKLRSELTKDIARASDVAKTCGLEELLWFCYILRLTHMYLIDPAYLAIRTPAFMAELNARDEALKYAIGLIAKHGTWAKDSTAISKVAAFDRDRVKTLENFARHINAKFDLEPILHVAKITKIVNEHGQHCYINLNASFRNFHQSIYLQYGFRIEKSGSRTKEGMLSVPDLVRRLYLDFFEVSAQFEDQCGISLEDFCKGILELEAKFHTRYKEIINAFGIIDAKQVREDDIRNFASISRSIYFFDAELENSFNANFVKYLRTHPFDPAAASENELRFHYLSRRPFLMGQGFSVLSPDLFLDSVLDNVHFTLLEGENSKAEYMQAGSSRFLDQVSALAANRGGGLKYEVQHHFL